MTTQDGLYRSIVTGLMWRLGLMEIMEMDQIRAMCVSTNTRAVHGVN